ncbi:MAG: hypothetical protein KDB88_05655 [Flavobacteriales bacterium]|nr:hypothetical protein [Flavobacteriales bacterium]MCB0794203.1 hypothetical protein [Flavobacteriales bacterium]
MRAFHFALFLLPLVTFGQEKKWYVTSGGEWIFSVPILDVAGNDQGGIVRFSPVVNAQFNFNYDFGKSAGLFTGLAVRNVGFIYQVPDTTIRKKFRTYNLGVPVGLKFGNMNSTLFFLGYELELPINYKEKTFENERKTDKFNVWFSDRNESFMQAVFAGVQFKYGTALKFKYYLSNFHNKEFSENVDGVNSKPYAALNANVFYVSLSYALFRNSKFTYSTGGTPASPQAMLW